MREALESAREKRTMSDMRDWSLRLEGADRSPASNRAQMWEQLRQMRKTPTVKTPLNDGWGTPLAIHILPVGYEIRSAGADRVFDKVVFEGEKTRREQDLIFSNGVFVQWPEGVISLPDGYDPRPKKPTTQVVEDCSRCHGGRY
jgi:hypothetical protein